MQNDEVEPLLLGQSEDEQEHPGNTDRSLLTGATKLTFVLKRETFLC